MGLTRSGYFKEGNGHLLPRLITPGDGLSRIWIEGILGRVIENRFKLQTRLEGIQRQWLLQLIGMLPIEVIGWNT